ncbi:MAG: hypothetical protein KC912_26055 [Proteobacteria bacterium]|nr:hypothetical protein [Pseudomonadota bacterium]
MAHRRLCRARTERIAKRVSDLTPADADFDQVRQHRSELQHCPGVPETQARLLWLEESLVVAELEALKPRSTFEHVFQGYPWVRLLDEEHEWRATYAGWLGEWVAHLESLDVGPVTAETVDTLLAEARGGEPAQAVAAESATRVQLGELRATADASCPGLSVPTSHGEGVGPKVQLEVVLSNCRSSETSGLTDVAYQVERQRWEQQEQMVPYTTTVRVPVSIPGETRCYQVSDTRQSCFTDQRTVYRSEQEVAYVAELVDVQVTYYETEIRQEMRYRRTDQMSVQVTASSATGTRTWTRELSEESVHTSASTMADYAALFEDSREDAVQTALGAAREAMVDRLVAEADLRTLEGVEMRLTAAGVGRELTDAEEKAISVTLGVPRSVFEAERAQLHVLDVAPVEVDAAGRHSMGLGDGILLGFPIRLGTYGLGWHDGFLDLPQHKAARGYTLTARLDVNVPLMLQTPIGGFGLHVVTHGQGHVGLRGHRSHVYVEEPPEGGAVGRESWFAVGAEGSAGLLVGHRNGLFGVFAGVRPRSFFAKSGHASMGGASVPLAARFELRPVPRRAIIVSAWGFALDEADPMSVMGASVVYPVFEGGFLIGEFARDPARVQVRGLHRDDVLEAGEHPHQRVWAGFGGAF